METSPEAHRSRPSPRSPPGRYSPARPLFTCEQDPHSRAWTSPQRRRPASWESVHDASSQNGSYMGTVPTNRAMPARCHETGGVGACQPGRHGHVMPPAYHRSPTMLAMSVQPPFAIPERPILVVDDDAKIVRLVRTYL